MFERLNTPEEAYNHQLGATLSSWLGGWAYERYGTHWIAFGAAGVLLIAAGVVALQLPRKGFTLMAAPIQKPA